MMIQKKVQLWKRPFRCLLALALIGGVGGAPLLEVEAKPSKKSSSRSSRSSSKSSASRVSQSKSSSRSRTQRTQPTSKRTSRPTRTKSSSIKSSQSTSSRIQRMQPKSTPSISKRTTRSSRTTLKSVPQKTVPLRKTIQRKTTQKLTPQKSTSKIIKQRISQSRPAIKITPKSTRPALKIPQTNIRPSVKGKTKIPKSRVPSLKIPDRKTSPKKVVPKPGKKTVKPKPGKNPNVFKPGKGINVPKPNKGTNVLKPGKGTFVPKPGKGKQIPPFKGLSGKDLIKKPGKQPGKTSKQPGKQDLSKFKGISKGKGKPFKTLPPSKKWLGKNGVPLNKDLFKGKNIKPINKSLDKQLKAGKLNALINSKKSKNWNLKKQFGLHKKGDVARRMHFHKNLLKQGGWRNRSLFGRMSRSYTRTHFGFWYAGPGLYPRYCWSPHWSDWVSWSWWDWCHPICDPRPLMCRPVIYEPCVAWDWYECPVWQPLPVVTCGTWVDVDPLVVNSGLDLQMLAVRFVDSGHPEEKLGPRFRVWFRNNSTVDIHKPFNVMLMASNTRELTEGSPEAGSRIDHIDAGQIQSVDIRLPFSASTMSTDAEGYEVPFEQLHVLIDSHREIPEAFEENNGAVVARVDVLPVDPALFSTDTEVVVSGALVNLAGEGLGPEPGKVLLSLNDMNFEAEIHGWYDLGVRIKMPELPLLDVAEATLLVVRGDGAASNPIEVQFSPQMAEVVVD